MNWKQLIIEAKRLMAESGSVAFDRAKVLCQLYTDSDFIADCDQRKVNAEDELDGLCDGLNLTFMELREMLGHYPRKQQWQSGRLRKMYDEMTEAIRKSNPRGVRQPKPEVVSLREKIKELQSQLSQALTENRKLRHELQRVKKTIESLELV
jgi:hypothetical protein